MKRGRRHSLDSCILSEQYGTDLEIRKGETMTRKKKILIIASAVLVLFIAVNCMLYPKTPLIDQWIRVCVHTTESGYWPPTDSKMDRFIIWLYMRTALPIGDEDSFSKTLRDQVDRYGMSHFFVAVNVDDMVNAKQGPTFQFVISVVHDNIFFDRMMFHESSMGNNGGTYWITLPGFWRYLDRVHTRLHQEVLDSVS